MICLFFMPYRMLEMMIIKEDFIFRRPLCKGELHIRLLVLGLGKYPIMLVFSECKYRFSTFIV
ncbi:hypothetical protein D0T92_00520 [Neisseria zalophi]|uniref:Uncharacterized protein n=1 Tax=Neisseria zalophi TaxID=640030 RepID=A0A5J6PRR9_9NEIS|nr:hypothetical protein D0T92_00520 [Neisseria zalophi]